MRKFKIVVLSKKTIYITASIILVSLLASISLFIHFLELPANIFIDQKSWIIVIDPGHGGIDGGANKDGILEKDINLAISKKLKTLLEQEDYKVIITRDEDISLDSLNDSSSSRHQRDLNARVHIINNSNAQLFLSIHVNCNFKDTSANGAIVFYNDKYQENKALAYCIQRALNSMIVDGKRRTIHDPQQGKYFLLNYSKIPGVIVETAFLSNLEERQALTKDEFIEQLAKAIAIGVKHYLNEPNVINKIIDFYS